MPPSSLIFVVILAVWAAYLIQHWVRRRDHIATARSVDRFSEAMRVLERRQRTPRNDLSTPAPRSYVVAPARPAHPEVVVKRAKASPRSEPVVASRASSSASTASSSTGRTGSTASTASPPAPTRAVTAPLSGARGRGTTLLLASLAMVLGTALGVLEIWPLWTVAAGIGVFVLTLAVVRTSVRRGAQPLAKPIRERTPLGTSASPDDQTRVSAPARRPRPARSVATAAGGAAAALAAKDAVTREPVSHAAAVASATNDGRKPQSAVYDVEADEARQRRTPGQPSVGARESAQKLAGTWQPVPVPVPTYTLKARASAPHTPSPANGPPTWSVAMPTSRSASAQDLPFDGYALAFEEESEELPAVHSLS